MKTIIAWTGGNRPVKPSQQTRTQAAIRCGLFREQIATWKAYWGDSPDMDTLRIFFRRANYDAHATIRD